MENLWKQITDFDPHAYKDELLVCQIWLGMGSPVFVTCKYNRVAQEFYVVVLKRLDDGGVSLGIPKLAQAYQAEDIKCWAYLDELIVSIQESKSED